MPYSSSDFNNYNNEYIHYNVLAGTHYYKVYVKSVLLNIVSVNVMFSRNFTSTLTCYIYLLDASMGKPPTKLMR